MIINNEFVVEQEYRELRQLVKEKDSNKRKVHWDIGRIEKRAALSSADDSEEKSSPSHNDYIKSKKALLDDLQKLTVQSKYLYSQIKAHEEARNGLAHVISKIVNVEGYQSGTAPRS